MCKCILCLCLIIHNGFGQSVPIDLICFVLFYMQIIRSGYYLYIVQSVLSFVNNKIVVDIPLFHYYSMSLANERFGKFYLDYLGKGYNGNTTLKP